MISNFNILKMLVIENKQYFQLKHAPKREIIIQYPCNKFKRRDFFIVYGLLYNSSYNIYESIFSNISDQQHLYFLKTEQT